MQSPDWDSPVAPARGEALPQPAAGEADVARTLDSLHAMLEATTDGLLLLSPRQELLRHNENLLRMWSLSAAELRAAPSVLDLLCARVREPAVARAYFERGTPPQSQRRYLLELPGGRTLECFSRDHTVAGVVSCRVWCFQDVTEYRRTQERLRQEARVLEVLNATGKMLASQLDLGVLLQSVTDAATDLSGAEFGAFFYNQTDEQGRVYLLYTLSGAPRAAFEKLGHPRATPIFAPTFEGGPPIRCDDVTEDPRYGKMGGMPPGHLPVRSYLAVSVVSRNGDVIGGLFFGHSRPGVFDERAERIVAGVAAQAAVAVDNARLYQNVRRASAERETLLERERSARSAAERASAVKDEFLATVSHELRTPLNAILGWSQMLRLGQARPEHLEKGLATIERNARAQTQLIDDLLDMSRILAGKVRLDVQSVAPTTFIEAAIDTVRPAAAAKGVSIIPMLEWSAGTVLGDPSRLQQVLWNLLSNAIKFTPSGGKIQITLVRTSSHIEISVSDTGIGIPAEFLPHVFDRFRQAEGTTTRRHGGLGLGLSIVKHVVELHGGVVQAHSAGKERGSTFVVTLPVGAAEPPPASEVPAGTPLAPGVDFHPTDLRGAKVLVVDDEEDSREVIAQLLAQCGAQSLTARSADEALQLLESERPDAIVSDIGMPDVDGYELLRRVRRLEQSIGGRIPAVALTAFVRPEDRMRALRAGFLVHLAKPVEPAELVASIASALGRTALE